MSLILPLPADNRPRRLIQLVMGLLLFGFSIALMVRGGLGLDPWSVFHQGISRQSGLTIGSINIVVSIMVMGLWIPLRQRPGLGTLTNAIMVGLVLDASLVLLPASDAMVPRSMQLGSGVFLNGIATGLYIGAGLGPGPRDGLMMGLSERGWSIRVVRTLLELGVLSLGWLLGGTVGLGTVAFALAIGPLAHVFVPLFTLEDASLTSPPDIHSSLP